MRPQDRLIVAIDEPDADRARLMIDDLASSVTWFKVGMTLYFKTGPVFVQELIRSGAQIFLDLKCHDIPHQVEGAVRSLSGLGVGLITVHTGGGPAMLEAAARGAQGSETKVLGVTVLTSLDADQLRAVGADPDAASLVLKRAKLAVESGLDGVVASPLEAAAIKARVPLGFEIVTPGIRPLGSAAGDQRRISTPSDAIAAGASRLVVGRPITQSDTPGRSAEAILNEIQAAS